METKGTKYLYCEDTLVGSRRIGLTRNLVIRETKTFYLVRRLPNGESLIKIPKKKMRTGEGYSINFYSEENQELKDRLLYKYKINNYLNKLKQLADCRDEAVIQKIVSMKIPQSFESSEEQIARGVRELII